MREWSVSVSKINLLSSTPAQCGVCFRESLMGRHIELSTNGTGLNTLTADGAMISETYMNRIEWGPLRASQVLMT
jgi:hypothetical protein